MKIFFLAAYLGAGGAERVVSLLANKMSQIGHDIGVVCLKYNDVFYQIEQNVQLVFPMDHCNNRLSELFWLRKFLKSQKPDVVIPFTEGVYCFTILSLLGTGIPIIASERLDPAAMSPTRKVLKKLLLPYVDWLVVQTQSIKEYFPKSIQKKTSVIYNPVNDDVFEEERGEWREVGKFNRIISVGRLYPQKNQEMMIRAFAKVADEFPDWQLVIYGEGPLRAELEFQVSSFKLEGRVLLPGRTEHVIEELRRSKFFCLSSDYEGMSNAMIEALCVGLPIISTKVSGTEELIKDGENGFLVEIGEEKGFTNSLLRLLSSKELREEMSKRNQQLSDLFHTEAIMKQWIQLIYTIIKR